MGTKKLTLFGGIFIIFLLVYLVINPSSVSANMSMFQDDTQYETYTDENGNTYIIDRGSGNQDTSITDVMGTWGSQNKPDAETMKEVTSWSQGKIGLLTSALLYIIFGALFFTTACDLLYIGVPASRQVLYKQDTQQNNMMGYQNNSIMSNMSQQGQQGQQTKQHCYISPELKNIMSITQQNPLSTSDIIHIYFKKRAFSIGLTAFALITLIGTSLWTDMGLNIGAALLKLLGL